MNVIFGLLLIILGLLAVSDFLGKKASVLQGLVNKISPWIPFFGLAALLLGFGWMLEGLYLLLHVNKYPLFTLTVWVLSPTMIALGMLFGLEMLDKIVGPPSSPFMLKAMEWRGSIRVYQNELGAFAIVMGILYLFF